MLNRLTYPPAAKTWHIAAWQWIPREGYWLLVAVNFPDDKIQLGERSDWIPPRDGGTLTELWVIAKHV